jgi:hypothetical protein
MICVYRYIHIHIIYCIYRKDMKEKGKKGEMNVEENTISSRYIEKEK